MLMVGGRKGIRPVKTEWWGAGMVICQQGADLHMAQLMPLPLTVSCFSKIQIGFTFLVPAHLGSPGKRAVKYVCVCVSVCIGITRFYSEEHYLYVNRRWKRLLKRPTGKYACWNAADFLRKKIADLRCSEIIVFYSQSRNWEKKTKRRAILNSITCC